MNKHEDHGKSYKGKQVIVMAHRDLVHDHHGRNLGSMQADMVLEKELSILMS